VSLLGLTSCRDLCVQLCPERRHFFLCFTPYLLPYRTHSLRTLQRSPRRLILRIFQGRLRTSRCTGEYSLSSHHQRRMHQLLGELFSD
jgi:hypothetical protein